MNHTSHEDTLMRALGNLPPVVADPQRAADLRTRCRARLEKPETLAAATLEPTTVGAVCAMYAIEIVRTVIR